jgi:methylthioribose-1-phosphate isomerase
MERNEPYYAFRWVEDHHQGNGGYVSVLDQRQLPHKLQYLALTEYGQVADAIRNMVVRGAPAIGVVAAYGYVLGIRQGEEAEKVYRTLCASRPTAVNLQWALDRLRKEGTLDWRRLLACAHEMVAHELQTNKNIAENGAKEILARWRKRHGQESSDTIHVLHHCNTGTLATAGGGTALGVIRRLNALHGNVMVHVNETRPRLQGARLTCWELDQWGIPHELSVDAAAPFLMARGLVHVITVGADRIAADGSVANKIGTYMCAVSANHHNIPFYVCAPCSTIDLQTPTGAAIQIEERSPTEVLNPLESPSENLFAPQHTPVYNPAFDITPPELVTGGIVTELGVLRSPKIDDSVPSIADQLHELRLNHPHQGAL